MNRQQTLDVLMNILDDKIIEPKFSGIMHVEIHANNGGIRHLLVAPQPEKIVYDKAPEKITE